MILVKHAEPSDGKAGRAYVYVSGHYVGSLIFSTVEQMNEVMGHLQDARNEITFEPIARRNG